MNAQTSRQQTTSNDLTERATRTMTLVWGRSPGKSVQARWLDPRDERQEVNRQELPQALVY